MDPLQILSRLGEGSTNPPTDAELTTALAGISDALDAATSVEAPTAADIALAKDLHTARETIAKEQADRAAVVDANRAELAKLRDGVFSDETPEAPEETPEETPEEIETPEALAAGARDLVSRLTSTITDRVPAENKHRAKLGATLKAVGPAQAYDLSADAGFRELGELFSSHGRSESGKGVAVPLVRLTKEFQEERRLGSNVELNNRRIAEVMGTGSTTRRPIAASGGICGPGDVDHSHPICSQGGRVVTPALPQFNASRGRVTVSPSISIGDLAGNVSVWTSANDANPTNPTTKPCPPLTCPEEITESVDAIVKCVTVGNFQAKFSPEWWAANLEVLQAAHDRLAEQTALEQIHTQGTSVGTVNEGSTLWNFIQLLRNVVSADRSHRRNWDGRYIAIADAYGRDQIRNQLMANLGSGVSLQESMAIADSTIDGWIADAGVDTMIWTYDGTYTGSTHRVLPAPHTQQGHLPPTDFGVEIFPEEAFMFLDGGTLDLGTEITDSTLNATNDRQAFAETFEKVLFRGCGAWHGVVTIDASCGCALTSI